MFIGNKKNVIFFEKAMENGGLSHAYCLCGSESIGKLTLAKQIAVKILKTTEDKLSQNPSFYYFERGTDEKTGKMKKEITVAQAREIKDKMTCRGWNEDGQVLILNGAQYLNAEAGNALLKALEEPAEKSFLFLLGDHEKNILPTVLSRCQKISFLPASRVEIVEGLQELKIEKEKADLIAMFSKGMPGKAISLAQDEQFFTELKKEIRKWLSLFKMNFMEKIESLEDVLVDKDKDGNKVRELLIRKMDLWLELWRELLLFKTNQQESKILEAGELVKLNYSPEQIGILMDEIVKTQNYLKNNVQTRLAIEQFLLKY
ncbi:MAG: hypothetical protein Q7J14_01095 [Candidatus Magasanikbacteria bacterium]|nr:hypothetical protein [Candidatus Magasanikbacteria bacterium]